VRDGLIQDHGYEFPQGSFTLVVSPISLTSGRTLADWASFVLTVRQDPGWPRAGALLARPIVDNLDPVAGAWSVAATLTGTGVGTTLEFDFTAGLLSAGLYRYSFDVEGVGGTAGNSPLVVATWIAKVFAADYAG